MFFFPRLVPALKNHIIIRVSCGHSNSFAIDIFHSVFAWGGNEVSQLGLGEGAPKFLAIPSLVGHLPNDVEQISCGNEHTLALCNSGSVYSWGNGDGGLLGTGDLSRCSTPKKINFFDSKYIIKIECGGLHNMALSKTGQIYAWGCADGGQLGFPVTILEEYRKKYESYFVPTPLLLEAGDIKHTVIVDISCGEAHTLATDSSNHVYGWGFSNYGQLGQGFTCDSFEPGEGNIRSQCNVPTKIQTLENLRIKKVIAGCLFSLFLSELGELI